MKRARKLLRAYKELNNNMSTTVSNISVIGVLCMVSIGIFTNIYGLLAQDKRFQGNITTIADIGIVIMLLIICSIYMGYFEDRRDGTKNNLKELTMQLPVSRKEMLTAQYIGMVCVFLPIFLLFIFLNVLNSIQENSFSYSFLLGIQVIGYSFTFCIISAERGLFNVYYVDPRIRECVYASIAVLWMVESYSIQQGEPFNLQQQIEACGLTGLVTGIKYMGYMGGILLLMIVIVIGYLLSVKLPLKIERNART